MKAAEVGSGRVYADRMSEPELQDAVIALAKLQGWMVFHPYDSRRSTPGFPDLTLVRGHTLIFAELKSAKGYLSREQGKWLAALEPVADVYLWRPQDLRSGAIAAVLQRNRGSRK